MLPIIAGLIDLLIMFAIAFMVNYSARSDGQLRIIEFRNRYQIMGGRVYASMCRTSVLGWKIGATGVALVLGLITGLLFTQLMWSSIAVLMVLHLIFLGLYKQYFPILVRNYGYILVDDEIADWPRKGGMNN